jgi:hypothetical protein
MLELGSFLYRLHTCGSSSCVVSRWFILGATHAQTLPKIGSAGSKRQVVILHGWKKGAVLAHVRASSLPLPSSSSAWWPYACFLLWAMSSGCMERVESMRAAPAVP